MSTATPRLSSVPTPVFKGNLVFVPLPDDIAKHLKAVNQKIPKGIQEFPFGESYSPHISVCSGIKPENEKEVQRWKRKLNKKLKKKPEIVELDAKNISFFSLKPGYITAYLPVKCDSLSLWNKQVYILNGGSLDCYRDYVPHVTLVFIKDDDTCFNMFTDTVIKYLMFKSQPKWQLTSLNFEESKTTPIQKPIPIKKSIQKQDIFAQLKTILSPPYLRLMSLKNISLDAKLTLKACNEILDIVCKFTMGIDTAVDKQELVLSKEILNGLTDFMTQLHRIAKVSLNSTDFISFDEAYSWILKKIELEKEIIDTEELYDL